MAKSPRKPDRTTKSTPKKHRTDGEFGPQQSDVSKPRTEDEFVSDAEIEARERGHLRPKGHTKRP